MVFNSLQFAVFFPIVTLLYFRLPHKQRWLLLLVASAYFYMTFVPAYILILGATIVVDYYAGILIEEAQTPQRKQTYLTASLIANLGFLAFFKYFNFINVNVAALADALRWNYPIENLNIILPIGLSFHTFQAMSYTIEVFRGRQKAERHFGIYALYVLFFPQLVAGPIERPQNMLHQFYEEHSFDAQRVADGLKLMVWGLFKKVVIADRLAALVDYPFSNPYLFPGPVLALAAVYFGIQIYCDFSGYSDIAIGAAQVMGFKLMTNFKRPFYALSISEFWTRWHISLSSWFRAYLFFPLERRRFKWFGQEINLLIVFLCSGLWHGASWTYVVWGGLHGIYVVLELEAQRLWKFVPENMRGIFPRWFSFVIQKITFLLMISYSWIFFRASSLELAGYMARKVFTGWDLDFLSALALSMLKDYSLLITFFAIAVMEVVHYYQERGSLRAALAQQPKFFRWALYVGALSFIVIFGKIYNTPTDFIYFQF